MIGYWKRGLACAVIAGVSGFGLCSAGCYEHVAVGYDEPAYYDGPAFSAEYVEGPYFYWEGGTWHHWDRDSWNRYHNDRRWIEAHRFSYRGDAGHYHEYHGEPRYHVGHGEHHGTREEERGHR